MTDQAGGRLVLRGTNVSAAAKTRSDLLPPVGEDDFRRLRDEVGLGAIRMLVFWEAVEPERGGYDVRYLERMRGLADAAGRAGLRVVVDMHQDLWGRGFGSAGAPEWTADRSVYARFGASRGPWFLDYFRPAVAECFERLWTDDALQEAFAEAWRRVARVMRGCDAVVAYDLFNEPFWGTGDPDRFDRHLAPRFYGRVVDAIRAEDPEPWIALEPSLAANAGYPSRFVPPARARLLFAPHFYPPAQQLGLPYRGTRSPLASQLRRLETSARRAGLPLIVGEAGVRRDVPGAPRFVADVWDLFDEAMLGAFHWDLGPSGDGGYGLWDRDGGATDLARALARPAPLRVAGEPLGWRWDRARARFELRWHEDGSATGDTIVAVPSLAFPDEFHPTLDDRGPIERRDRRLHIPSRGGPRHLVVHARRAALRRHGPCWEP